MIKDFEPRLYQETIFNSAAAKNTLVVLPTGMGKTNIFLMMAAHRMNLYPKSKILLVGPTRPLIDQYLEVFKKYFEIEDEEMAVFTGMVSPEKRKELWDKCRIIFSTPQGLENDIISGRIILKEVSLFGVDEAHRAVGNYAYVWIAKQYMKTAEFPRIVGMTASPGTDMETIKEICQNLSIENVEVRSQEDADVKPYVKDIEKEWIKVKLPPEFIGVQTNLKNFIKSRTEKLKQWDILKRNNLGFVSKRELLELQAKIRGRIAAGEKDYTMWNAISVLAEIMKVSHAIELLETQGVNPLLKYLQKMREEGAKSKSKAAKNIAEDIEFRNALFRTEKLAEEGWEHPKLIELQRIIESEVKKDEAVKILVFNQYRENALDIRNSINKIEGVRSEIFVGQQKKEGTGLSQKEQKEILDKFRENEYNIIVATSIGEEGLDIPKVDIVIFYEPIPSAIRSIQRRGRTGRQDKGKVIVLMTEKTRDETYRWAEYHKEKRMYRNLSEIKNKLKLERVSKEAKLSDYGKESEKIKVFADYREKGNLIIKELIELGSEIKLEQLENADYLLSGRVGVEFKTKEDFVNSIIDGRLLEQLRGLRTNFERPLIIVEGEDDIYSIRNVHPNAIRGMISTIIVSYGIPLLQTKNYKETASILYLIAKREQDEGHKEMQMHPMKPSVALKKQQEFVVSSLPSVGLGLAKDILKKFGSVRNFLLAKPEEIEEVPKIGKKISEKISQVLDSEYE